MDHDEYHYHCARSPSSVDTPLIHKGENRKARVPTKTLLSIEVIVAAALQCKLIRMLPGGYHATENGF